MSCDSVKGNLGLTQCRELPSLPKAMITTPKNFVIPAATIAAGSAAILSYLQDALSDVPSLRIYLWPNFSSLPEDISEAAVYQDSPLRFTPVRDGNYRFRFGISESLCLHKKMFTQRSSSGRVIIIDILDQFIGTGKANGDFAGLTYNMLNTEKFKFNNGTVATESPVVVGMSDNQELDKNGMMLQGADFFNDLESIVDVELTQVGSLTTTKIVVDVKVECDGTPLSGLVTADFIVTTTAGASQVVTAAESATVPGRYTLTGTGLVAGFVTLRATNLLTVQSYEVVAAIAVA